MSLSEELERFRIEALGKLTHDMDIIDGFTGYVREINDARERAMERLSHVINQPYDPYGPAEPPQSLNGEPINPPWPVNGNGYPTETDGHFQYPIDHNGHPIPDPAYGYAPPPPPGYRGNGHAPPQPPPLAQTPMRQVLHNAAGNGGSPPPRR